MSEKFRENPLIEALQKNRQSVPKGEFHAWAQPEIRIPRDIVRNKWDQEIDEAPFVGTEISKIEKSEKEFRQRCKEGIAAALKEVAGPREYFSLRGYGDFEKRLFQKKYWQEFTRRFPEIAPYLENIAKRIHSRLYIEFSPAKIKQIEDYLAGANYPDWTPNFFKRHKDQAARGLHTWVRNHIKGFNGQPDWTLLISKLSKSAQEKFSRQEPREPIPDHELIPRLKSIVEELVEENGYWTPQLVSYKHKTVYERLRIKFRTPAVRPDIGDITEKASRPNWHTILLELPEDKRKTFRWAFGREMKYRTEEDAVREINDILTQWQPKKWGPRWLEENGFSAIRLFWENHFRKPDGTIDWGRLLGQLPKNLQEGFIMSERK